MPVKNSTRIVSINIFGLYRALWIRIHLQRKRLYSQDFIRVFFFFFFSFWKNWWYVTSDIDGMWPQTFEHSNKWEESIQNLLLVCDILALKWLLGQNNYHFNLFISNVILGYLEIFGICLKFLLEGSKIIFKIKS